MKDSPIQVEPKHCAEARVIDAASWLVKAAAQLSVMRHPRAETIAGQLESFVYQLLDMKEDMAGAGAIIGPPAHELMIRHALLNACGHAWYAGDPSAEYLLKSYQRSTEK